MLQERLTFTRCLSICSLVPLQSLRRRRAARIITVIRSPWGLFSCQPRSRESERQGRGKKKSVYGTSCVFVLKSSFAKRQNINIISLFLLVLACDNVPAEARLTLIRGSPFSLGFSLPQVSGEERKQKKNVPSLLSFLGCFICFPRV